MNKQKTFINALVLLLCLGFSSNSYSDEIKKQLKNGKFLLFFDTHEPSKGEQLKVMGVDGSTVGTMRITAVRGNRAIGRALSGKERIRAGQSVVSTGATRSKKSTFLGVDGGYVMPGFTYMTNTISYGLQFGLQLSPQFAGFLDISSFSTSGFRFYLPSLNGQFNLSPSIPLFFMGGVGVSYVKFLDLSIYDPMLTFSAGYEAQITPSLSVMPRLWGSYVFGINALTSYQILQGILTLRVYL